MEAKLNQIQEKDAEIGRQQREIQTLRVRICDYNKVTVMIASVLSGKRQNTSKDEQLAALQAQLQQLQVSSTHV